MNDKSVNLIAASITIFVFVTGWVSLPQIRKLLNSQGGSPPSTRQPLSVQPDTVSAPGHLSSVGLDYSGASITSSGVKSFNGGNTYLENRYDDSNHLYLFRGSSYSFDFDLSERPLRTVLRVRHLSSASHGQPGITPVTLYVNGETAAKWRQLAAGFEDTKYDISSHMKTGRNTIAFAYDDSEGTTGYWQKWVRVDFDGE